MKLKIFIIVVLSLSLGLFQSKAQVTASDCPDGINACTNPNFVISPSGSGLDEEFTVGSFSNPSTNPASTNSGCLLAGELNSTWIIITCVTSGTLEFSMGDGSSPGCMDWIMWPYNSSACADISNNALAPIRCNWNGACLGFTGCAAIVPPGANALDFEPPVNANAGDQFIVCFSNYSGQSNVLVPMDFFGTAQVSCYNTIFICPGEQTTLSGLTGMAGSTYAWTPTTGIIGSTTSQTITVSPGSTTVYECVTTQPNSTILDTMIQVSLHTPAGLSASVVIETCQGDADGSITVTPNGTAPFSYTIDGVANANGTFSNIGGGTYLIEVTDGNGCVSDTTITVPSGPVCCTMTVSAIATQTSCFGSCDATATGSFAGNNGIPTFVWEDELGNPIGQTAPTAIGLCAGNYTVLITDPGLCTLSAMVTVTDGSNITVDSITVTEPLCFGDCNGTITITAASADSFSIDNGTTYFSNGTFDTLCSGSYSIVVKNAAGCSGNSNATITDPLQVTASFLASPAVATMDNPLVQFLNTSENQTQNFWQFDSLGTSVDMDPSFEFPSDHPDSYLTCLTVSNDNNCTDSACLVIQINDGLLYYVPNAFTPDGDGKNDIFIPVLNNFDEESYEMLIFNRWGQLIFSTEDIFTGWDGTSSLGPVNEKVKDDVYVWKISGKDKDSGHPVELIGHVTLFK